MEATHFDELPEGMSPSEVAELLDAFLSEQGNDDKASRYHKLEVISDKQWHTYEKPDEAVKTKVTRWIRDSWEDDDKFYELAMGLCYCFALEKDLFRVALERYRGDQRWEYAEMLDGSIGDTIDPYWRQESRCRSSPL